jgi:lipopolysaccharide biosynthesis glycosyltransferase
MKEKLNVYIGYDSRQDITPEYSKLKNSPYEVCKKSIENFNPDVKITPIKLENLVKQDLYRREVDPLASTEFTYSRFLTPYLNNYEGIALFCDSDFLWLGDIEKVLDYYDEKYAVMCVQHDYTPKADTKMDGYKQTVYPRKNWSSLMLFNCAHPDCKNLSLDAVNNQSPKYLHRMEWTADENIGSLPLLFNWLEGEYQSNVIPQAVHFTNGGPWYKNWNGDYNDLWVKVYDELW